MSKLATTRPDDCVQQVPGSPCAAALPASRNPSSECISTGPCSSVVELGHVVDDVHVAGPAQSSLPLVVLQATGERRATVLTMPDPVAELVRLVRRRLAEAADPERAPQMQAYMKSAMPYRGVTSAPLRAAAARTSSPTTGCPTGDAWESAVRELWDERGVPRGAVRRARAGRAPPLPRVPGPGDRSPLYRHLVVTGAWWDLVDPVATRTVGGVLAGHPEAVDPGGARLGRRRRPVAAAHRDHLPAAPPGERTDLDLLTFAIEANLEGSRHGREFFVRKAIGWALRQHARTDPDWVRAFVAAHEDALSGLSRREALKHL